MYYTCKKAKKTDTDQTARMCRLVCAFVIRIKQFDFLASSRIGQSIPHDVSSAVDDRKPQYCDLCSQCAATFFLILQFRSYFVLRTICAARPESLMFAYAISIKNIINCQTLLILIRPEVFVAKVQASLSPRWSPRQRMHQLLVFPAPCLKPCTAWPNL